LIYFAIITDKYRYDSAALPVACLSFQAIKSKLIECGVEVADGTKTAELAEKVGEVYEAGRMENDAFWDEYQTNGNRTDYDLAFGGKGWTTKTFKPQYDMIPLTAYMMFRKSEMDVDLVDYLDKLGVKLDLSKCTNHLYLFNYSQFTRVGEIDLRASTAGVAMESVFSYAGKLKTIDKVYLRESGVNFNANCFRDCRSLEKIAFVGEITDDINFQWSPNLSYDSFMNILSALSQERYDLKATFSREAVNKAFETSPGANDGATSPDWIGITTGFRENWKYDLV
jgi:hypothetical protein